MGGTSGAESQNSMWQEPPECRRTSGMWEAPQVPNPKTACGKELRNVGGTPECRRHLRCRIPNSRPKRQETKGDKRPMTLVNLRLGGNGEDCASGHESSILFCSLSFLYLSIVVSFPYEPGPGWLVPAENPDPAPGRASTPSRPLPIDSARNRQRPGCSG